MANKHKDWEQYESVVKRVLRSPQLSFEIEPNLFINFSNSNTSKKKVFGASVDGDPIKHQIDVQLFSKAHPAILYGECKFHKNPVEKSEISAFIKVIENIQEYESAGKARKIIPVFVSNSDFQYGAKQMLDYYDFYYFKFSLRQAPVFKQQDIIIVSYFSNGKWHKYDKSVHFYNSRSGTSENLELYINGFWSYRLKESNKWFIQSECIKNCEYIISASDPKESIAPFIDNEIQVNEKVTKIIFKYKHRKRPTKIENPEIGELYTGKHYVVYKNLQIVEFKDQHEF